MSHYGSTVRETTKAFRSVGAHNINAIPTLWMTRGAPKRMNGALWTLTVERCTFYLPRQCWIPRSGVVVVLFNLDYCYEMCLPSEREIIHSWKCSNSCELLSLSVCPEASRCSSGDCNQSNEWMLLFSDWHSLYCTHHVSRIDVPCCLSDLQTGE